MPLLNYWTKIWTKITQDKNQEPDGQKKNQGHCLRRQKEFVWTIFLSGQFFLVRTILSPDNFFCPDVFFCLDNFFVRTIFCPDNFFFPDIFFVWTKGHLPPSRILPHHETIFSFPLICWPGTEVLPWTLHSTISSLTNCSLLN